MSHFVITFVSLALLLSSCQADFIGGFCSQTNNPSLCDKVIRSDPGSQGADARGLANIALKNAIPATQESINVAKSVSNPGNKEIIDTCIEVFKDASDLLNKCKGLIPKRDPRSKTDLATYGSAAETNIDTCSDEFEGAVEPPALEQAIAKADTFIGLLLAIVASKDF